MKRITVVAFLVWTLIGCQPPPPAPAACTPVSSQGWWQAGDRTTDVPQSLVDGEGGHLHIDVCFPVNQRVDGDLELEVHVLSHMGFTGSGDRLDVGVAPSGKSIARVPAGDAACGPKPAMCHQIVPITLDTDTLPAGLQSLRIRYLSARHPSGDRQFTSNELPICVRQSGCRGLVEAKGWFEGLDYARAGIRGGLPTGPQTGVITVQVDSKANEPITAVEVRMDARFGADDFGTLIAAWPHEYDGPLHIDTRRFTSGRHCLAVLTSTSDGAGVNTGVLEIPLDVDNPGAAVGDGHGACFQPQEMP